ncbi:hypothetical protein CR513_16468, partial [Mucuna pruriens]
MYDRVTITVRISGGKTKDFHIRIDMVLIEKSRENVNSKLELQRQTLGSKVEVSDLDVTIGENFMPQEVNEDVTHMIQVVWLKWRNALGVICGYKVPTKLKGKFFIVLIYN